MLPVGLEMRNPGRSYPVILPPGRGSYGPAPHVAPHACRPELPLTPAKSGVNNRAENPLVGSGGRGVTAPCVRAAPGSVAPVVSLL